MTSFSIVLLALFQAGIAPAKAPPKSALTLVAAIPLPGVEGRIDHMALDPHPGTLFVAALENGTIEVVDLRSKKALEPYPQPEDPQGVVYIDSLDMFVVTDGELGCLWRCSMPFALNYDPDHRDRPGNKKRGIVGPDADNIRYLSKSKTLLVAYGSGGLGYVDLNEFELQHTIELGGHPESFQINAAETRAWANVPDRQVIAVVDLDAKRVLRSIELKNAKKNYPMALVESEKRLLVGCREPAKLLVLDIDTDTVTAELPLSGDVDDIFVDSERGLVYASCGEGFIDVFERTGPGAWTQKEKVSTSAGARTCLFVASEHELFVAVPHRGDQTAEIRVFSTAP